MGQALLSLCMIVKNEEKQLPSFIEMHRELFDEWVIVDTGSSDRTEAIIREAGLPLHRWEWTDDFAAARNHALSLCTGRWVAAFDADERLAPSDQAKLKALISADDYDALLTPIKNYVQPDPLRLVDYHAPDGSYSSVFPGEQDYGYELTELIRFFRNQRGFRWESKIHEVLDCYDSPIPPRIKAAAELFIHHLGTLNQEKKDGGKAELYAKISQDMYAELKPSDSAKTLYEGARYVSDPERKLRLLDWARKKAPRDPTILKELVNTHATNGAYELAIQCCEALIELQSEEVESYLAKAHCLQLAGHCEEALDFLRDKYPFFRNDAIFLYTLARLSLQCERWSAAQSYAKRAHKQAPQAEFIAELVKQLTGEEEQS